MNMTKIIKVTIVEPSEVIRVGLETMLKRLTQYRISIVNENIEDGEFNEKAIENDSDIYILNPLLCGLSPQDLNIPSEAKTLALVSQSISNSLYKKYDGVLNAMSLTTGELQQQIETLLQSPQNDEASPAGNSEGEALTPREKEIVICVVKGLTNKEIAKELFLSTHTVITHRRNISKKLQIHSASGLTIYAIVNKLVELDEINS
ncbi:response regulator transcription factor [Porphyromonas macacae]|uniref:Response regulator protein vraR n=1 Tax=Porphyromonas macacae TaxID=28115 RepID=A0A379DHC8_9PORP|nr:LuxR C-terminal-related transcriptional regulator [Porphyromonas macacae]SUB77800.1 Response regulator protein vraR [Porphyromonas macacae]